MHGQRRRMFVWQLLFACCMLRVVGFMPSVVYCGVHGMCCILHAARCVSYDACCMLIVARCTRHAGDCNTEPLASMGHARTARLLRLLDRRGRAWHAAVPYPFPSLHARAHSRSHARTTAHARALSRTRSARSCACTSGGRVGELLSRTLPAIARLALALPSVRRHEQRTLAVPPCSMHVSCSMQRAPCIHPACTVRHSSDLPAGTHAQRTPLRSRATWRVAPAMCDKRHFVRCPRRDATLRAMVPLHCVAFALPIHHRCAMSRSRSCGRARLRRAG